MVVDDTLSMRIYSFIDNILINKTIKQIKQKIDFIVFCVRHLGLIVTAVTINGFTPVTFQSSIQNLLGKHWSAFKTPQTNCLSTLCVCSFHIWSVYWECMFKSSNCSYMSQIQKSGTVPYLIELLFWVNDRGGYRFVRMSCHFCDSSYGPQPCTRPVFYLSFSVSCEGCGLLP